MFMAVVRALGLAGAISLAGVTMANANEFDQATFKLQQNMSEAQVQQAIGSPTRISILTCGDPDRNIDNWQCKEWLYERRGVSAGSEYSTIDSLRLYFRQQDGGWVLNNWDVTSRRLWQ